MPKKATPKILSKLPVPSRFLLADENWEDYEYRQLELITRCYIDIDRQYRMISQHLNPPGEAESKGAEIFAEWHHQALMNPDAETRRRHAPRGL